MTSYSHLSNFKNPSGKPVLSVLIPFYKDDPSGLLRDLIKQSDNKAVEILLYDDGTNDPAVIGKLEGLINSATPEVTLIIFLADYLALIQSDMADIIFGGFTVPKKAETPDQELHRALSEVSDCLPLSEEDSEWAARVSQSYRLVHADIPALHLGLEGTDILLRRFKDSAENYVRFTNKHPEMAKTLKLYIISKKLKSIPGQALMRPLLRAMVKFSFSPIKLRLMALKLWRASWYAEALS